MANQQMYVKELSPINQAANATNVLRSAKCQYTHNAEEYVWAAN